MKALLAVAVSAVLVSGCLSMQNQSTLDGVQEAASGASSSSPFVEAFIEYVGPQARWAAPRTFSLHVVANGSGTAEISLAPESSGAEAPVLVKNRAPASQGLSAGHARDHLAYLAAAIEAPGDDGFSGCLSPIRVRMIRADGSLLEKQGCRNQSSWSKAASETFDFFMHAAMVGEK